ncbi:MAG: hypothetical protein ACKOCT_20945 [Alphaproteobacteria bacterium]
MAHPRLPLRSPVANAHRDEAAEELGQGDSLLTRFSLRFAVGLFVQ